MSAPREQFSSRLGFGMELGRLALELNYERGLTEFLRELVFAQNQLVSVTVGVRI